MALLRRVNVDSETQTQPQAAPEPQPQAAPQPQPQAAPQPQPQPQAAPPTPAARPAATPAPATQSFDLKEMTRLFDDRKDALKTKVGDLPRLIGSNGNVLLAGDVSVRFGEYVDIRVVSWSERWTVSPGSDDEAAKAHVRYSYDGKNIDSEEGYTVAEYLDLLRANGYPKASFKLYYSVVGVVTSAEKMASGWEGELVEVQLSPSSRQSFDRYRLSGAFRVVSGRLAMEQAEVVRFRAQVVSAKGNNWTKLVAEPSA